MDLGHRAPPVPPVPPARPHIAISPLPRGRSRAGRKRARCGARQDAARPFRRGGTGTGAGMGAGTGMGRGTGMGEGEGMGEGMGEGGPRPEPARPRVRRCVCHPGPAGPQAVSAASALRRFSSTFSRKPMVVSQP
ncbi:MAG: hypothetical protein Kow0058_05090 [Roseovarius sp.]